MSAFDINLGLAYDFPNGAAGQGGWYCRSCGDPINKGDMIYRPATIWVCQTCFDAGLHTPQAASNASTQNSAQKAAQKAAASAAAAASAQQKVKDDWDAFQAQAAAKATQQTWNQQNRPQQPPPPSSNRGSKYTYVDDDYKQTVPPPAAAPASDIEEVNETNWIEIVFEVIPDRHIKRVYAALARTYHPDVGGDEETQIRINAAYQKRKSENV